MSESVLRVGINDDSSAGTKTVTANMLRIEESAMKAARAVSALENSMGKSALASLSSMGAASKALMDLQAPVKSLKDHIATLEERFFRIGATIAVFTAIGVAFSGITSFVKQGIQAVSDYQQTLISLSASLTQIAILNNPSKSKSAGGLAEAYRDSSKYAAVLAEKMREVDLHSVASYDQIMQMLAVYTSTGKVLDVNNKTQMAGFTALSNAIPMMTTGQDRVRQMTTEMRALATGTLSAGSTIARAMDAMIKADGKGGLKALIAEGKKTGTDILELIEPYLQGYTAALPQIAKTLETAKTSFETVVGSVLRKVFSPIIPELVAIIETAGQMLQGSTTGIFNIVQGAWNKIKAAMFDVTGDSFALKPEVLQGFKDFAELLGKIGNVFGWVTLQILTHMEVITKVLTAYGIYKATVMAVWITQQLYNAHMVVTNGLNEKIVQSTLAKMKAEENAAKVKAYLLAQTERQLAAEMALHALGAGRTVTKGVPVIATSTLANAASNLELAASENAVAESIARVTAVTAANTQARMLDALATRDSILLDIQQHQIRLEGLATQARYAAVNVAYAESKAMIAQIDREAYAVKVADLRIQQEYIASQAVSITQQRELAISTTLLADSERKLVRLDTEAAAALARVNAERLAADAINVQQVATNEALGASIKHLSIAEQGRMSTLAANNAAQKAAVLAGEAATLSAEKQAIALRKVAIAEGLANTTKADAIKAAFVRLGTIEAEIVAQNTATRATLAGNIAKMAGTAATYTLSAATTVLSGAMSLVGGPLVAISLALYGGYLLWQKYGDAAEKARKQAAIKMSDGDTAIAEMDKEIKRFQQEQQNIEDLKNGKIVSAESKAKASSSVNTLNDYNAEILRTSTIVNSINEAEAQGYTDVSEAVRTTAQAELSRATVGKQIFLDKFNQLEALKQVETPKGTKPQPDITETKDGINAQKSVLNAYLAYVAAYYKDQIAETKAGTANLQSVIDESYRVAQMSQEEHIAKTYTNQKTMLDMDKKFADARQKETQDALTDFKNKHARYKGLVFGDDNTIKNGEQFIGDAPGKGSTAKEKDDYKTKTAVVTEFYKLVTGNNAAIHTQNMLELADTALLIKSAQDKQKAYEGMIKIKEDLNIENLKSMGMEVEAVKATLTTAEYTRTVTDVNKRRLEFSEKYLALAIALDAFERPAAEKAVADAKEIIRLQKLKEEGMKRQAALSAAQKAFDLEKAARDNTQLVSAFDANQTGRSSATGALGSSWGAEKDNALAVENDRFNTVMANLQAEKALKEEIQFLAVVGSDEEKKAGRELLAIDIKRAQEKIKNGQTTGAINANADITAIKAVESQATKMYPKITSIAKVSYMAQSAAAGKYAREGKSAIGNMTSGQVQMMSDAAGVGAAVFQDMADSQDQASRDGFESAKMFSIAAAIMSTAQAVMGQLAGTPGPAGWAMAAAAAVLGVIQVAKIASTSYGGGGSVASNVPSGSFSGGAAGSAQSATGGVVGGSIGAPINSVHDSLSGDQLARIAGAMENASMALTKVADGLTKISSLFQEGGFMGLIGGALRTDAIAGPAGSGMMSSMKAMFAKQTMSLFTGGLSTMISGFKDAMSGNFKGLMLDAILPGLSSFASSIFGGAKSLTGEGVALSLDGGRVSANNYQQIKTSGGWFRGDSTSTNYVLNNPLSAAIQTGVNSIQSTVERAAIVLGTQANIQNANIGWQNFSTAGKSADDINNMLSGWLTTVGDVMAKTVVGLRDYAFYGENAFDAIVRLANSLQTVNTGLEMIGHSFISATLAGGNMAFKLVSLMGGTQKYAEKLDGYFTSILTDIEQSQAKAVQGQRIITITFREMGIQVPKTNAEFKNLVNSMDLSTESGVRLFAALLDIAPTFKAVQEELDKVRTAIRSFNNDLTSRVMKLQGLDTTLFDLRIQHEDELKKATLDGLDVTRLKIVQEQEWADAVAKATGVVNTSIKTTADTIKNAIIKLIDAQQAILTTAKTIKTGPASMLSPQAAYQLAKSTFAGLQAKLATNPQDITALKELPGAANDLLSASKSYNASGTAYQSDLQMVLDQLALSGGAEDSTLDAINEQLAALIRIRDAVEGGPLILALGPTGTLADLLGAFNTHMAATLQRSKEDAAAQTRIIIATKQAEVDAWQAKVLTPAQKATIEANVVTSQTRADSLNTLLGQERNISSGAGTWSLTTIQNWINKYRNGGTDTQEGIWGNSQDAQNARYALMSFGVTTSATGAGINGGSSRGGTLGNTGALENAFNQWQTDKGTWRTEIGTLNTSINTWKQQLADSTAATTTLATLLPSLNDSITLLNNILASYIIPPATATATASMASFAVGTDYVSQDMMANIHEGEIIMDRQSANVLRKYGIPTKGSADNSAVVSELQETNRQLVASVRVLQAGFTALIDANERQASSTEEIASKTTLAKAA